MNTQPASSDVIHPYIERRPNMQSGRPVIKGNRFPVSSIVQSYRRGLSVEDILREFPHLHPVGIPHTKRSSICQRLRALRRTFG